MAEGVIKKILAAELQQQTLDDNIEVYPVTATSAVFNPKTNQSLDDILASINTRITQAAASGGGGTITSVAGLTYIWAFAGFKGDSEAIADLEGKVDNKGIPPGWQESSNVNLQDGEMLYMTTARKQGDKWLTWTKGSIWSTPVRLGSSGTTSGTGSDGQGYNYIYCRTSTGQMPSFQVSIEDTTLVNAVEDASKYNQGISVREVGGNVAYVQSSDPTDVWYDHPDGVTATIPYEWILVYQGNEEEWTLLTPQPILWSKYGVNGQDGDGVEYIFCAVSEGKDATPIVKNNTITGTVKGTTYTVDVSAISTNSYYQQDDFIPEGWSDEPVQVDQDNPRQYVSIRKKKWVANEEKSKWGLFTEPKIWTEIPIVKAGADRLSLDWSNNNVNVVQGETGQALIDATTNYLSVKIGSTPIPYTETLPEQGLGYTLTISESSYYNAKLTSIDQETDSSILIPMGGVQLTELLTNAHTFAVSVTVKVKYNEDSDDIYTQIASFNVNVKDEVYEIIASPTGFNLSAIDTKSQEPLTVRVQRRNSTQATRFLTQAEITSLGTLQYTYKPSENTITLSGTSQETEFTIPCNTDNALSGQRQIYLEFNSNARGYEDSETIMIARDGNTGDEGNGIEYIFYLADRDIDWSIHEDNPTNAETNQTPEFKPTNWTDDLQEVTESNPVQYVSVRRFKKHGEATTKSWGQFEPPVVYNRWVPSPYSMSISNDSVIIDDNTDSITLANASFCQLHIFSGQDEITTNSDYTFEITPLANNGADGVFQLNRATTDEIETIGNGNPLNKSNMANVTIDFGAKQEFKGTSAIAFYITKKENTNLQINSYGIQYQLVIKKSDSIVASLYKVQPIKVANFSADGTIYKLNITNDTWTYNGDTGALIGPASSTVTVAKIKGATAEQQTFSIGKDAPENPSTGLYVKTSSDLVSTTREGQLSHTINPSNVKGGKYPGQSSYSLELYFNGVLVDAETIDCRKDGKTGAAGSSCYLTCDNDNIIVDLEASIADLNLLSAYTLQLWEQNIPIQGNDVKYSVEVPIEKTGGIYAYAGADGNYKEGCFSCGSMPTAPVSFQATAKAEYNKQEYTKTINITIKQLQGEPGGPGISYKLVVSPNSLHYNGNGGKISGNNYTPTCTVTKISNGEATSITDLNKEGLSIIVKPQIQSTYKAEGYDYILKLNDTIVDQEHVDCLKDGKQGNNGIAVNSSASFYIDLQDQKGPSLHINANFNCTEEFDEVNIYWGDQTADILLIGNQFNNPTIEFGYSIDIPYKYITTGFILDYSDVTSKYTDIEVRDWGEDGYTGDYIEDGWGTGTYITLVTKSMSKVIDTKVIYRTGTEGYYFDNTSNHFISTFSKAENIHPQVTVDNLDLFEVQYSKKVESSSTPRYNEIYNVDVDTNTDSISIEGIPAATISGGQVITKDGFTLVSDSRVDGEGTVQFKSFSKRVTTSIDTPWNDAQPEPIIQVCTVLCYEWSLYYNKEIPAIPNQDYVISFYIRLKRNTDISMQPYVRIELKGDGGSDQHFNGEVTTEWKRFFIKAHNSTGSEVRLVGGARTSDLSNLKEVVTFEIGGFQITRGSDLAPWAPYSGETMSVLLQTSKEFNSTVSQVTANKTNISTIQQQAHNIQVKVNKSGLEVTDTGTTFTGDVKANNFTVINNDKKPIMEVLVATTKIELENGPAIEIGEPYIRLTQYGDSAPTYKYVGLYSLQNADTVDALTYNISTIEGYPLPTLKPQLGISLEGNSTTYYQLKDIRLLGEEVTTGNPPINNGILWCKKTPSSSGIQLTYEDEQYKLTGGTAVSEATTVTTYIQQISNTSAFYVLYGDFWYQVTDILYGDRIYITNDTTLRVNSGYVCVECSLPLSVIPDGYHWAIYQANAECEAKDPNTMKIIKRTEWFELVNSIEQSSFLGFKTITPIT